jgi:hypothetical protein
MGYLIYRSRPVVRHQRFRTPALLRDDAQRTILANHQIQLARPASLLGCLQNAHRVFPEAVHGFHIGQKEGSLVGLGLRFDGTKPILEFDFCFL